MNIAYVCDKNYVNPFLISLGSLIRSNSVEKIEKVYIFIDFDKKLIEHRIKNILSKNKFEVIEFNKESLVEIQKELNLTIHSHISLATYYRLFISEYLPKELKKIIYLDCDTVILKELFSLYEINIENHLFGAILDMPHPSNFFYKNQFQLNDDRYFNAGVLIINLQLIRSTEFLSKCIFFIKNSFTKINLWDQDVINVVASGKIKELGYQFNYCSDLFKFKTLHEPTIIHYAGYVKPWNNKSALITNQSYDFYYWDELNKQSFLKISIFICNFSIMLRLLLKRCLKTSIYQVYKKIILRNKKLNLQQSDNFYSSELDESLLSEIGIFRNELKNYVVNSGPFIGLQYFQLYSFGSSILPKIVGIYERELHPIILETFKNNYTRIINIGCAEGYYLIGYARKFPTVEIVGIDSDNLALDFCKKMLELNGIQNKIQLFNKIDHDFFENPEFLNSKSLIICDCEGYERNLFSIYNAPYLINTDILIELYDFVNDAISEQVFNFFHIFHKSHEITFINSESDIQRIQEFTVRFPQLSYSQLQKIISEKRPNLTQWFWIKSRK
jgi:lipopolysaccharide biosynthesis glycosyltransferase